MKLSGGEQQRLAVARALLARPDWLFLDEATANLEPEAESELYRVLRQKLPETTIVSIAHQPNVAKRLLDMLKSFDGVHLGFGVDQLHHMLQTATMAKRANAKDEIVLCALLHDVGKFVSVANHGGIAAEMLKPYVSSDAYQVVKTHQDFQGKHYYEHFGMASDLRERVGRVGFQIVGVALR